MPMSAQLVDYLQKLLLFSIHLLYAIFLYVANSWLFWRRKLTFSDDIVEYSKTIKKLPIHIVFVINGYEGHSYLSMDEISSLIYWSVMLGLNHISLYDNRCFLPQHMDSLEVLISKKLNDQIRFVASQKNGSADQNIIYVANHKFSVIRILSKLDFKRTLASLAKDLIKKKLSEDSICSDPIKPSDIDNSLFMKLSIPDPDLAVICSPTPCLFGLLPWHTRLTEIINLPKTNYLVPQDFIYVIDRYQKCQQRFGK